MDFAQLDLEQPRPTASEWHQFGRSDHNKMIAPRHMPHAPIKEAIIDIQTIPGSIKGLPPMEAVEKALAGVAHKIETINRGVFGVKIDKDTMVQEKVTHQQVGYKVTMEEKNQIVQLRKDGFTFSQLEPYATWEDLSAAAKEVWEVYKRVWSPQSISRIATRFINVLPIPLPVTDLTAYLTKPPEIPDALPQGISSFISRIVIHNEDLDADGIITQAFERFDQDHAPITLDIDVFINKEFDIDSEDIWSSLSSLRRFKNSIFFESITEQTAEMFQ